MKKSCYQCLLFSPFCKWVPASLALMLSWNTFPIAHAQTFKELEQQLLDHPSIVALRFSETASRESAAANIGLPDPVISVGVNNVPLQDPAFDRFLPTHKAIGVRQSLPNFAERRALSSANERRASLQKLQAEWQFVTLRAKLISLLATQTALSEQLSILAARDIKYNELEEVIRSEIDAGRPAVFRIADIDIERADSAREKAAILASQIEVSAGIEELVLMAAKTPAPETALALWDGQATRFYAVRLADQNIDISEAGVSAAKAAFRPDWGVSLTYQQREEGSGAPGSTFAGDDWFSASVSVTVPIWSRQNQQPKLRAAKANANARRQQSEVAARAALAEWRVLSAKIEASNDFQKILREKISALDSRIEALTSNYEAGLGDYSTILDTEITQLKFQSDLATERARQVSLTARANSLLVTP
ncbi:TolC family protein [Parvularcula sp. IMCC14364]|uniref:TolC family protein n=1 Tax=Parvularcula sp. IMCC14364 TaxID=3067902 RepID=UPI002740FD7C|nr:TolC family protein [Parvularcula sp. IMCC14364]